jgi:hypothetical protein
MDGFRIIWANEYLAVDSRVKKRVNIMIINYCPGFAESEATSGTISTELKVYQTGIVSIAHNCS